MELGNLVPTNNGIAVLGIFNGSPDSIESILMKHEGDKEIFLFKCNEKLEVEQNSVSVSIEEAKHRAPEMNHFAFLGTVTTNWF